MPYSKTVQKTQREVVITNNHSQLTGELHIAGIVNKCILFFFVVNSASIFHISHFYCSGLSAS